MEYSTLEFLNKEIKFFASLMFQATTNKIPDKHAKGMNLVKFIPNTIKDKINNSEVRRH